MTIAAEQGDMQAQWFLGWSHYNGELTGITIEEGLKWLDGTTENNISDAGSNLDDYEPNSREIEQDDTKAIRWWLLAAAQGHSYAQHALGRVYHYGEGVEPDDKEAVKWFTLSAEQENREAQLALGTSYMQGVGIEQDKTKGIAFWRLAAEQDQRTAQYALGRALYDGDGIRKNRREALKWFRRAADQGHAGAQEYVDELEN